MALFTDGPPACVDDLAAQDSQLLNIANVEGIDVSQKLKLAQEEIGIELFAMLSQSASALQDAVLSPRAGLHQVVVTPPLKLWHAYRALEMVYADAYHSQLNDRYAGRRDQFRDLSRWAREKLVQIGVGMTDAPVAQAAQPAVSAAPGGPLPDGTYYVSMTWTNSRGDEGAASHPVDVAVAGNTVKVVPGTEPTGAAGWNVYLGTDPAALTRQNGGTLRVSDSWSQYVPAAVDGARPGTGQQPFYIRPIPRLLQRG